MAKSKKTKIHKKIDGQILQMNKQFSNLKMKQKDKITEWVYEEYKKYVTEHDKVPDLLADEQIVEAVLDKINEAQIWILMERYTIIIGERNHNFKRGWIMKR